eukprot:5446671-Pyramimonas_sp.AAC.1
MTTGSPERASCVVSMPECALKGLHQRCPKGVPFKFCPWNLVSTDLGKGLKKTSLWQLVP